MMTYPQQATAVGVHPTRGCGLAEGREDVTGGGLSWG